MKRISVAIAMIAIGVAVGVLVFGFGTIGDDEGTRGSTDNSYMDSATYVGSDTCQGCHNNAGWDFKWDHWNESLHSKMIQDPVVANVIGDFTIDPTLNATGIPDVIIDLDDTAGVFTVTLDNTTFPVNQTVGSFWKQRYLTQINASLYFLPIQWNVETTEWVPYHLERWYNSAGDLIPQPSATKDSWDRGCAGCHSTGTDVTYSAGTNEWTAMYSELNAGCESCHGPGSEHAATMDPDFIWKSADAQVCGQCHIRGSSNGTYTGSTETLGYPWSATQEWYMPGDTLAEFYTPGEGTWGDEHDSSKKHHQQYRDWTLSGHSHTPPPFVQNENCASCHTPEGFKIVLDGGEVTNSTGFTWQVTCASCHDTHDDGTNEHQLRLAKDVLCGECHTVGDSGIGDEPHHPQTEMVEGTINITDITGTPWMAGSPTCADCHMPKTAKSALPGDISSHTFKFVSPDDTIATGVPNGCTATCHDGTGTTLTDVQASENITAWQTETSDLMAQAEHNMTLAEEAIIDAFALGFSQATIEDAQDALEYANYTYHFVEADASMAHNHPFAVILLEKANEKANDAIDLLIPGTVEGTVVDSNGDPIADVQITSDSTVWATTDSSGGFEFDIAPGSYTFTILQDGEEIGTFEATSPSSGLEIEAGEEVEPEADLLWLYLLIIVIIIVVIIIAVVVMKKRGGPSIEEEPMEEEEMAPEPEPEPEPEMESEE